MVNIYDLPYFFTRFAVYNRAINRCKLLDIFTIMKLFSTILAVLALPLYVAATNSNSNTILTANNNIELSTPDLTHKSDTAAINRLAEKYLSDAQDEIEKGDIITAANLLEKRHLLDTTKLEYLADYSYFLAIYQQDFKTSQDLLLSKVEHYSNTYGDKSNELTDLYSAICQSYYSSSDYKNAIEYCLKTLEISEQVLGKNDIKTANAYHSLGNLYEIIGDYQNAFNNYEAAINAYEATFGREHFTVAEAYSTLGNFFYQINDFNQALICYNESLDIRITLFGADNPDLSRDYSNVGATYFYLGDYDKAIELYNISVDLAKNPKDGSPVNQEQLDYCYTAFGSLYRQKEELDIAMEYFQLALEAQLATGNYVALSQTYNNISEIHYIKNELDLSLEAMQKSLEIYINIYGTEHPMVATSYNNIGMIYNNLGDYNKALEYLEVSIATYLSTVGEDSADTANTLVNLAEVYINTMDYEKATTYLNNAMNFYNKHPETFTAEIEEIEEFQKVIESK